MHNRPIAMALKHIASVPVFILIVITRAVTRPFRVKIDHGYYFRVIITLRKYYSYALVILRYFLQRIPGTSGISDITFAVVYVSISHRFFYFQLRNMPALHTALCMIAILQIRYSPVKTPVTIYVSL